jgi:plastocyanin
MPNSNFCSLLFLILVLIGCSSADNKDVAAGLDGYPEYPEMEHYTADAVIVAGAQQLPVINRTHFYTIEIRQMKFDPAELTVKRGDTVIWINNGITAHDVTEQPGNEWTSSSLAVGSSWQMIATRSADYYCSIHVVMKGKLIVK